QNKNNLTGSFVFEKERFKEIDSLVQLVRGLDLEPYKFVADDSKNEIYFGDESRIFFDNNQDIHSATDNLQAVLNMKEFEDRSILKNLDYVDLRFGNKIFYK
ncbi:hypothetical protein KKG48_00835, partial [Patescibacteria group bacterium]|nr:hypothetical protein [Patescibacteria group bacterium]